MSPESQKRRVIRISKLNYIQGLQSLLKMPAMDCHVRRCNTILIKCTQGCLSETRRVINFQIKLLAGKSKFVKHPIFDTKTGWHWFTKASRASEFTTYGVGMTLYFQFLKFLAMMFFILAFLNIPAYIFFASGNPSALETSKDLKAQLASLSLGNIG
jgi:hypothetical protein